jgi:hypothetical protein
MSCGSRPWVLKEWGEVQRAAEPPAEIVRWVGGSGCGVAWVNIEASAAGDDDLSGEIHGLLLAGLTVATFSNVVIPPMVGQGCLPPDNNFLSIVCRARMVSTRDNEIYTGSGL